MVSIIRCNVELDVQTGMLEAGGIPSPIFWHPALLWTRPPAPRFLTPTLQLAPTDFRILMPEPCGQTTVSRVRPIF